MSSSSSSRPRQWGLRAAGPVVPSSIGNGAGRKITRYEKALVRMEEALGKRDYLFSHFERPARGRGVVAVAVNGERVLMHLGADEADAMYNLAAEAVRR